MISIRKATESDVEFMIECINKDYQINDYQMDFDDWITDVFPGKRDLKNCTNICLILSFLKIYI